jgi:hypothetical protein
MGGPDPMQGGLDSIPRTRPTHVVVLDLPWGSRLHTQRSGALPWGSGLTVDILEHSFFPGHVAAPDPPMWCGRALLWALSSGL